MSDLQKQLEELELQIASEAMAKVDALCAQQKAEADTKEDAEAKKTKEQKDADLKALIAEKQAHLASLKA